MTNVRHHRVPGPRRLPVRPGLLPQPGPERPGCPTTCRRRPVGRSTSPELAPRPPSPTSRRLGHHCRRYVDHPHGHELHREPPRSPSEVTRPRACVVNSDTCITATTPPGTAGAADDRGDGPVGSPVPTPAASPTSHAPTITSIAPSTGTTAGGDSVVITGTGFTSVTGASGVTFGGTNAASYTVNSATQHHRHHPGHAAGARRRGRRPTRSRRPRPRTASPYLAARHRHIGGPGQPERRHRWHHCDHHRHGHRRHRSPRRGTRHRRHRRLGTSIRPPRPAGRPPAGVRARHARFTWLRRPGHHHRRRSASGSTLGGTTITSPVRTSPEPPR